VFFLGTLGYVAAEVVAYYFLPGIGFATMARKLTLKV